MSSALPALHLADEIALVGVSLSPVRSVEPSRRGVLVRANWDLLPALVSRNPVLRASPAATARTLWALTLPEIYVLQVHNGDLTPDHYERWLADLLLGAIPA